MADIKIGNLTFPNDTTEILVPINGSTELQSFIIPSGTKTIVSNGPTDVTTYDRVIVNVPLNVEGSGGGGGTTIENGTMTVSATKGTVSNHKVTITPKAQVTKAGYFSTGTTSGTGVTVSASDLVSDDMSITSNGSNIDVANYATVSVNVPTSGSGTNTSDATAINADLLYGKIAYGSSGRMTGTMTNNGSVNASFDGITTASYIIPKGYHSGSGSVSLTNDIPNEVDLQTTKLQNIITLLGTKANGGNGSGSAVVNFNASTTEYKDCIVIGNGEYILKDSYTLENVILIGGTYKMAAKTCSSTNYSNNYMFKLKSNCTIANATFEALTRDKIPSIYYENNATSTYTGKCSNVNAFFSDSDDTYSNVLIGACEFNNVILGRLNNLNKAYIVNNTVNNTSMFIWASNCNLIVAKNTVTIPSDAPNYYYHIYYLDKNAKCYANGNNITINSNTYLDIYHLYDSTSDTSNQEIEDNGSVYNGKFQHLLDLKRGKVRLNGCYYDLCVNEFIKNSNNVDIIATGCTFNQFNGASQSTSIGTAYYGKVIFNDCKINTGFQILSSTVYNNCNIECSTNSTTWCLNRVTINNCYVKINGSSATQRIYAYSTGEAIIELNNNVIWYSIPNTSNSQIYCKTYTKSITGNAFINAYASTTSIVSLAAGGSNTGTVSNNIVNGKTVAQNTVS